MTTVIVLFSASLLAGGVISFLVYYLISTHNQKRLEIKKWFRTALINELQNKGAQFQFSSFVRQCEVDRDAADEVAQDLFRSFCKKAYSDGQITPVERKQLEKTPALLGIAADVAKQIETKCSDTLYQQTLSKVLADGKVSEQESVLLEQLRRNLGLTKRTSLQITEAPVKEAYVRLIENVISDGKITAEEFKEVWDFRCRLGIGDNDARTYLGDRAARWYREFFRGVVRDSKITTEELEELARFRKLLFLDDQEANSIVRSYAMAFFGEIFSQAAHAGDQLDPIEHNLTWIRNQFELPYEHVSKYFAELAEIRRLSAIRSGNLPSVKTGKLLEGGEICHWEGECVFAWQTATQSKDAKGVLIVSSNRLIFTSALKSFEFTPAKIVDVGLDSKGVEIKTSTNRGNGSYRTGNSKGFEAVLIGLVRKHKYLQSENFSSSKTRHIPDLVRRAVWDRDGGRCTRCLAMEYLEYDHIIPHSKGGANTEKNVQLLCRKCNGEKSDRI